jgi:hypothetical protein
VLSPIMKFNAVGQVVSTWWESGRNWQAWFAVAGSTPASVPSGQAVTALWNPHPTGIDPRHLDLFAVDQAGALRSTFFDDDLWRHGWFTPQQATIGTAVEHTPQPVAALWANSDQLDIFTANTQRQVVSTLWRASGGWRNWFTI